MRLISSVQLPSISYGELRVTRVETRVRHLTETLTGTEHERCSRELGDCCPL